MPVSAFAYGLVMITGFATPGLLNENIFLYGSNPDVYGDVKPHLLGSAAIQPQTDVQGQNAGEFAFNVSVPAKAGYTFFLLIPTSFGGGIVSGALTTPGSAPIAYVSDGGNGGHFGKFGATVVKRLR